MRRETRTAGLVVGFWLACGGALSVSNAVAADATASTPAASAPAGSARLEDYRLLALSSSEGVAVLRGPDRRLVTLRVGSILPSAKARLAQVLGDRLRFDAVDDNGLRQTAWMIRSKDPEQLPEVQRVSGTAPPPANANPLSVTTVVPLTAPSTPAK